MKNPISTLFDGPLVGSSPLVWCVALYALAKQSTSATRDATVRLNPVLLATLFACEPSDVQEAIEVLCEPGDDGLRLDCVSGIEYRVHGGEAFAAEVAADTRRRQNREAQRRHRHGRQPQPEEAKPL